MNSEKVSDRLRLLPLGELFLWLGYYNDQMQVDDHGNRFTINVSLSLCVSAVKSEIWRRENNLFHGEVKYQYRSMHQVQDDYEKQWLYCSKEEYEKFKDLARFEVRIIEE